MASNPDGIADVSLLPIRNSSAANFCTIMANCAGNRNCGVICPVARDEMIEKKLFL